MNRHINRADSLLGKMTIEEKAAQLYAAWLVINEDGSFTFREVNDGFIKDGGVDPKELLSHGLGQITRPLGTRPIDAKACVSGLNEVQKFLVEGTRLGIPAIPHEECLPGLMVKGGTLFPAAINYGATWNPDLMKRITGVIGDELYSTGSRQGLSPVLDVARDARWGRTEETFGEDPYLVGIMASAFVQGLQGENRRILATLKHYVGHSFSEGGRNHAPVRIGERELNDVFLLPFEMAVKLADAGSVMPAYHDIDGEPSSSSRRYLTEVLRRKWGFDGIIVSDYEAVNLLRDHHHVAADDAEATALAVRAGMDVELPGFTCFREGIAGALERNLLDIGEVDAAVKRVLIEKSRLGLFENPYTDPDGVVLNTDEHRKTALEAAAQSITLLQNDGILPLEDEGTIAVIGPVADDQLAVFCGYSFPVHLICSYRTEDTETKYAKTLFEAVTERAENSRIMYASGCDVLTERPMEAPVFPGDAAGDVVQKNYVSFDESGIDEAAAVARKADVVILAVGDLAGLFLTGTVGEGSDASSLELPGVQGKLVDAVLDTGTPVVLVLLNGRPYDLTKISDRARAVVEAWLPGQEGAEAVAAVLFGDVNPGGKLPVSFPKSAGAMPFFYNHKLKSAGTPIQPDFGALYPFGHGLSYSAFTYRDFSAASGEVPVTGTIEVSGIVENTSGIAGDEVVQLYTRDVQATLVRPVQELKGFQRIRIKPGAAKKITFKLPVDMLGFTVAGNERAVEPGKIDVMVGSSCRDIRFTAAVQLTGEVRYLQEDWRMVCDTIVEDV